MGKKWNGKESLNGLDFEGQYSFGNIWSGKVEKYNKDGELLYKGEYLNGDKYGMWEEYNDSGILIFKGKYVFGKKNGKAEEYDVKINQTIQVEYINGYIKKYDNIEA